MDLLTSTTSLVLWQEVVKHAENRCCITLKRELETYLISLLMRYTNQPDVAKQIAATAFLNALHLSETERHVSLQRVGDQCLIFTGLFPRLAEKRLVKINYFVDLGRSAYSAISHKTNDLYGSLALQFVVLMDVLQSIRPHSDLLPFEAYEQWNELGSQRALQALKKYTAGMPIKKRM
ncbi:MAG: hypothetical protein A3F11_09970 [Gammaproteobacteria bacterium RIFCSPHIGHO2_12_FULL_37_14]|nr:MAG: hypothetical protein A3F11_09970 [Gammaproteobacteria bacterium RIFCSPHIGHO2_12_FULL_37_14]